jgi:hypothetical protein
MRPSGRSRTNVAGPAEQDSLSCRHELSDSGVLMSRSCPRVAAIMRPAGETEREQIGSFSLRIILQPQSLIGPHSQRRIVPSSPAETIRPSRNGSMRRTAPLCPWRHRADHLCPLTLCHTRMVPFFPDETKDRSSMARRAATPPACRRSLCSERSGGITSIVPSAQPKHAVWFGRPSAHVTVPGTGPSLRRSSKFSRCGR